MTIYKHVVAGQAVTINHLPPPFAEPLWNRWLAHVEANEAGIIGLDVETTAIDQTLGAFQPESELRLVQFGSYRYAWCLNPHDEFWRPRIKALLDSGGGGDGYRFVSHTDYDQLWCNREFGTPIDDRFIDTIIMAGLLWPGVTQDKDLKALCDRLIDKGLSDAEVALAARFRELAPVHHRTKVKSKEWGFSNIELTDEIYARYAGLDAIYVRRLLDELAARLKKFDRLPELSRKEQRIGRMCTRTRVRGLRVDREWTANVIETVEAEFESAAVVIEATCGCSPKSPKRADWLSMHGMVFDKFTPNGAPQLTMPSAAAPGTIPQLVDIYGDDPVLGPVINAIETIGTHSNMLTNLRIIATHASVGDGLAHPMIKTQAAHTGRMSIVKPAMQTYKKNDPRLRGCFIAREHMVLVGADYKGQENRIAAAFSGDPVLTDIVLRGLNQHEVTAKMIFGLDAEAARAVPPDGSRSPYDKAKTLDFAQAYGSGPARIGDSLGLPRGPRTERYPAGMPNREAYQMWLAWRQTYARLVEWTDQVAKAKVIVNPFGRRVPTDRFGRAYANGNYAIQSTGRDLLGQALINLEDEGWAEALWLPVHDEIVLEVYEDEAQAAVEVLGRCMINRIRNIDFEVDAKIIGQRWGEAA